MSGLLNTVMLLIRFVCIILFSVSWLEEFE